jgi:YYY domain-containing protein
MWTTLLQAGLSIWLLIWTARFFLWLNRPESAPRDLARTLCDLRHFTLWFWVFVGAVGCMAFSTLPWRRLPFLRRSGKRGPPLFSALFRKKLAVPAFPSPDSPNNHWVILGAILRPWAWIVAAAFAGLATVWMFEPHAFTESFPYSAEERSQLTEPPPRGEFWRTINEQKNMVTGKTNPPYVNQYHGAIHFLYEIRNFFFESLGPPLALAALLGFLAALIRAPLRPSVPALVLLAWVVPSFVLQSRFAVKFPRYHAAELPVFILFGAWLLDRGLRAGRKAGPWGKRWRTVSAVGLAVTLIYTAGYALGMTRGFAEEHTWQRASRWIFENVPEGSKLAFTHWDDRVPVSTPPEVRRRRYEPAPELPLYESDTPQKIERVAQALVEADYVIFPTKRLYAGTMSNPGRYPLTGNFFKCLFAGDLGYQLVHTEANPIRVFGIPKRDDEADESFRVYERPKVQIFRKIETLEAGRIASLIHDPPRFTRDITFKQVLNARADRAIWEVPLPRFVVLRWLATLFALGAAVFPILFWVGRGSRLRGLGIAVPLGLAVVGYLPFLGASLKIAPFGRAAVVGSLALFGAAAAVFYARRWGEVRAFLARRRGDVVACALVFLGFFAFYLAVRSHHPAAYWGEKAMEFSFLNAVERAQWFPPADPWVAGRTVNYYYYGYVLLGTAGKIAGLPPRFVFNLAVATIPALVALAAFALMIEMTGRRRYGLLAALLICAGGSLVAYETFVDNTRQFQTVRPYLESLPGAQALADRYGEIGGALADRPALDAAWTMAGTFMSHLADLPDALHVVWRLALGERDGGLIGQLGFDNYLWKVSHGLIPVTAANEFPAWTFLFADLHPHMIVMPFALMFMTLSFLALAPARKMRRRTWEVSARAAFACETPPRRRHSPGRSLTLYALLGLTLGAIGCINTWDVPTCLLLLGAILTIRWVRGGAAPLGAVRWALRSARALRGGRAPGERLGIALYTLGREAALPLAIVGAVSVILYQPFHAYFNPREGMGVGVVCREWVNPGTFARIFGVSVFTVCAGALLLYLRCRTRFGRLAALGALVAMA